MKFTTIIGVFSLIFAIASCSQVEKIDNVLTKDHVKIGTTGIYLLQPYQFEISTGFDGFEQNDFGSTIQVENLNKPYSKAIENYEANLKALKPDRVTNTEYLINGMQAKFICYTLEYEEGNYAFKILIFGNDTKTTRVQGIVPLDYDAKIGDDVRKSILSVAFKNY